MKIRLKVKHLLGIVVVFIVAGLALGHVSNGEVFRRAEKARDAGENEKAVALYDRYLQRCDACAKADEALYWSAVLLDPGQRYGYVFAGARSLLYRSISGPADGVDDAETRYNRLIEGFPESRYAQQAVERLVDLFAYERRWDEAEAVLKQAIGRELAESRKAAYERKRIELALDQGDYEWTVELAQQYEAAWARHHSSFDVRLMLGDALRKLGQLDEAQAAYNRADEAWNEMHQEHRLRMGVLALPEWGDIRYQFVSDLAARRELLEQARLLEHTEGGAVVGQIEDYPEASIMIMLGESPPRGFTSNASRLPEEQYYYTAFTDPEGYFRFDNIPPGEYEIGLRYTSSDLDLGLVEFTRPIPIVVKSGEIAGMSFRIPLQIRPREGHALVEGVEGQIRIAWQDVPEVDYYYVSVRGERSSGLWFADQTKRTEYTLEPTIFRWQGPLMAGSRADGRRLPDTFLGDYEGGKYRVYVDAFKDGDAIAKSERLDHNGDGDTFVTTAVEELSHGEKLVLEERYEDAIEVFKRRLEEDPYDLTAAQVLLRIYHYGTNTRTNAHRDADAALAMLEHIMGLDIDPQLKESARFLMYGWDRGD